MDRIKLFNRQHFSVNSFSILQSDFITALSNHLTDFHSGVDKFVLTTATTTTASMLVTQQITPSLTLDINPGIAYYKGNRVPLPSVVQFTIASPPVAAQNLFITRVDLLGIKYKEVEAQIFSIDFLDINGNIYQEEHPTRILDSYELVQIQGTENLTGYSPPESGRPNVPADVIPLAWVYLRNSTGAIWNVDPVSTAEGYIVDCRPIFVP